MRFLASVFMLLTVCCTVFPVYFVGHALVGLEHEGAWPWIVAGVLWACAAVFGFIFMKLSDRVPEGGGYH